MTVAVCTEHQGKGFMSNLEPVSTNGGFEVKNFTEQSPGAPQYDSPILQNAMEFWAWYEAQLDTLGETHMRADLLGLYAEYQDAVSRTPIDLGRVESLTAQAALRLLGKRKF
jgi:hypothetical protein